LIAPALRADIPIAALTGVLLARCSEAFDDLSVASDEELTSIVMETIAMWPQSPAPMAPC
jgi:hypothetical protein